MVELVYELSLGASSWNQRSEFLDRAVKLDPFLGIVECLREQILCRPGLLELRKKEKELRLDGAVPMQDNL